MQLIQTFERAKEASRELNLISDAQKSKILHLVADAIGQNK